MISALVAVAVSFSQVAPVQDAPAAFKSLQALARSRLTSKEASPKGIKVAIDPRIELLSVIFRLAGNDEFRGDGLPGYANYIDHRFEAFKQHPAVQFAGRMRQERGVCCDGVVILAIYLGEDLRPRAPLESGELKQRWRISDARAFVELARDFALKSKFSEFLRENRQLYQLTEQRMSRLVRDRIDADWFARYFGERPRAKFIVAPGLLNGAISYGVKVQPSRGPEEMFANIGAWQFDQEGLPSFDELTASTVVHEFNHSFLGPTMSRQEAALRAAGEAAQKEIVKKVPELGYFTWQTMIEETLVRAVVARYLLTRQGPRTAAAEIQRETERGFLWIDDVYELLADYERSRDRYPTFESFVPRVVEYFDTLPNLLSAKAAEFDKRRPIVKETTAVDGLDPKQTQIQVTFDRPMNRGTIAIVPVDPQTFPPISKSSFNQEGTILTIHLALKPDTVYELSLNSPTATGFRDRNGILLKPHRIRFRTAR